jgi:hypothetical protein
VVLVPGTAVVLLSSLVMVRPVTGVRLSVSVALLSAGELSPGGTATVAVLLRGPLAEELIWAMAVKVTVPPGSSVTVVAMLPVPLAAATLEPGEATAVQETAVIAAGKRSVTAWSTTVLGPALRTRMV